jgi:hypothetical protein
LKKIAAILLLSIHLFDLGGYLLVHQYLIYRSDRFFNEQTAKNLYNKLDLVDVKIPISLPGIRSWKSYEPISGQIRFHNNAYNYIQMRVTRDTLFLKCVPNYRATKLNAQNIIHADPINDVPVPKKEHVPNTSGLFMDMFCFTAINNIMLIAPVIALPKLNFFSLHPIVDRHIDIPKQPPKYIC